jgi:hypothetical protein
MTRRFTGSSRAAADLIDLYERTSRLWDVTPEIRSDLITAVAVIRAALAIGFPVQPIEIDV